MLTFSCNLSGVNNCKGLFSALKKYAENEAMNAEKLSMISDIYIKMCTGELDNRMSEDAIGRYCTGISKNQALIENNKAKKFKTLAPVSSNVAEEDKKYTVFESITTAWYDTDDVYTIDQDELSILQELDDISNDIIVSTGFDLKKCLCAALDGSKKAAMKLKEIIVEENIGELIEEVLEVSDLQYKLSY